MRRYVVVRELFVRGRWEERPHPFVRNIFKFRKDAEAKAGYLRAMRDSDGWRYTVVRRPLK